MKQQNILFVPCSIVMAFLVLTLWSQSTSWLYYRPFTCDSAIFQVIGKYWANGEALPYRDLWDLKGPVIFLVNALGYMLTDSKTGVFLIQILFLSTTIFIAFIGLKSYFNLMLSALFAGLIPLSLTSMINDGNTVSEYSLPLLFLSFILFEKFLQKNFITHPWKYAFVYGLSFGWCLMSRLTDFIPMVGVIISLLIFIIIHKQWRNLMCNVIAFVTGAFMIILPFVLYFGLKGQEYEFWYGTVLYSIGYTKNSFTGIKSWLSLFVFLKDYLPLILMLVLAIAMVSYKPARFRGFFWLTSTLISLLWFLRSRLSPAYAIVTLPYIYVFVIELKSICSQSDKTKLCKRVFIIAVLFLLLGFSKEVYNLRRNLREYNPSFWSDKELIDIIPKNDLNSFVAYDWSPQNYLYENIRPCYRYFILQDFEAGMNNSLRKRVIDCFSSLRAKWILVSNYDKSLIRPILDSNYTVIAEKNGKKLMKRN